MDKFKLDDGFFWGFFP